MKFTLKRRDFSDLVIQPEVDFSIERYSWAAIGGPNQATITATGDRAQIFGLINHMRAPVEILNDLGDAVWWGYVARVEVSWEGIRFSVDLDSMSNDVAVAYTDANLRFTTAWSNDANSVAEYGQKEILLTIPESTATEALQRRDTYLQVAKYPTPEINGEGGRTGTARITCKGWLSTLDWRYYANDTGKESYEDIGSGGREIGEDDRPILAQSFQIASATAWTANSIWLRPWKQGDTLPTDNMVVSLKTDSTGNPGTTVASCTKAAADIAEQSDWLEFALNTEYELQPATTYWIHIARSGAVDATNYYMVDTNFNAGYERGAIKVYNTNLAAWVDDGVSTGSFWGDLLFKVVGVKQTTDQITNLVTAVGEFFAGTIIEDVSGVNTNPFRDGDSLALYELENLLATGTTNDRRLLCEVTRNRYLRVYEEPASPALGAAAYALNARGELTTQYNTLVDTSLCPVAVWTRLVDVIPASVDLSIIADPNLFLIEEAEVSGEKYSITRTRNQADIWKFGIEQG